MNKNSTEQNLYQAELLSNRLAKKAKLLKKWARKNRVSCYRLYDRDIPEVPLAIDLYEFLPADVHTKLEAANLLREEAARISANDMSVIAEKASRTYLHLYLYERPYEKDEADEQIWLDTMAEAAAKSMGIDVSHVITKLRKKQRGDQQYEKIESKKTVSGLVQEQGQLFRVNLSDYLDTGLFFDHRELRRIVRDSSSGKTVLNLFCYTGSFSVYAAEGKAKRVESVDLSNTYLDWAEKNMYLNEFEEISTGGIDESSSSRGKYVFTRADVTGFLNQKLAEVPNAENTNRYDLIILDPPTFSNSKATRNTLDINRDWSDLVTKCANLLNPGGTLYFSTNSHRLRFDENLVPKTTDSGFEVSIEDMTEPSLPEDFKNTKIHRLWKIRVSQK